MTIRRLTGLLIAVLMLHLTFVGASVRCAQGSELSVGGHHANGHHAGMVSETSANATQTQPHRTPVQAECCRAMMACAVTVALREEAPSTHQRLRDDAIIASLMSVPRSPITSPDPPPPKA